MIYQLWLGRSCRFSKPPPCCPTSCSLGSSRISMNKAWTNTADWAFSQDPLRISSLMSSSLYGGWWAWKSCIKPQRMGVRRTSGCRQCHRQLWSLQCLGTREKTPCDCVAITTAMAIPCRISRRNGLWMSFNIWCHEAPWMDLLVGSLLGRSQARKPNCHAIHQTDPRRFWPPVKFPEWFYLTTNKRRWYNETI